MSDVAGLSITEARPDPEAETCQPGNTHGLCPADLGLASTIGSEHGTRRDGQTAPALLARPRRGTQLCGRKVSDIRERAASLASAPGEYVSVTCVEPMLDPDVRANCCGMVVSASDQIKVAISCPPLWERNTPALSARCSR